VNLRSRSLYAIAVPSVCRLSVTLVHLPMQVKGLNAKYCGQYASVWVGLSRPQFQSDLYSDSRTSFKKRHP